MAQITLEFPTETAVTDLNDYCKHFGYQEQIQDGVNEEDIPIMIDNPESKLDYAKRMIIEGIKQAIKSQRANSAAETARLASIEESESLNIT